MRSLNCSRSTRSSIICWVTIIRYLVVVLIIAGGLYVFTTITTVFCIFSIDYTQSGCDTLDPFLVLWVFFVAVPDVATQEKKTTKENSAGMFYLVY